MTREWVESPTVIRFARVPRWVVIDIKDYNGPIDELPTMTRAEFNLTDAHDVATPSVIRHYKERCWVLISHESFLKGDF